MSSFRYGWSCLRAAIRSQSLATTPVTVLQTTQQLKTSIKINKTRDSEPVTIKEVKEG